MTKSKQREKKLAELANGLAEARKILFALFHQRPGTKLDADLGRGLVRVISCEVLLASGEDLLSEMCEDEAES